jgi:hypothetical protein
MKGNAVEMEMFSCCSCECKDCLTHYTGGCLAGHGDCDFTPITVKRAKSILVDPTVETWRKIEIYKKYPELVSWCLERINILKKLVVCDVSWHKKIFKWIVGKFQPKRRVR